MTRVDVFGTGLLAAPVCGILCGFGYGWTRAIPGFDWTSQSAVGDFLAGTLLLAYFVVLVGPQVGGLFGVVPVLVVTLVWPWLESWCGHRGARLAAGLTVACLVLAEGLLALLTVAPMLFPPSEAFHEPGFRIPALEAWGWSIGAAVVAGATTITMLWKFSPKDRPARSVSARPVALRD